MNAGPRANRAIAFFDGQNLFAAARDAFGFTTASYGVPRLARAIALQRGWDLIQTRFYTGMPNRQDNPGLHHHWTSRLRRMRADGLVVTARPLRRRRRRARLDDGVVVEFTVLEEKGIDVRIPVAPILRLQRVRVFVDFWNFQLSANDVVGRSFRLDWSTLSRWLGVEAAALISGVAASDLQFEGSTVYLSVGKGA